MAPVFDSKDILVVFVLGGPGVGKYLLLFIVAVGAEAARHLKAPQIG